MPPLPGHLRTTGFLTVATVILSAGGCRRAETPAAPTEELIATVDDRGVTSYHYAPRDLYAPAPTLSSDEDEPVVEDEDEQRKAAQELKDKERAETAAYQAEQLRKYEARRLEVMEEGARQAEEGRIRRDKLRREQQERRELDRQKLEQAKAEKQRLADETARWQKLKNRLDSQINKSSPR